MKLFQSLQRALQRCKDIIVYLQRRWDRFGRSVVKRQRCEMKNSLTNLIDRRATTVKSTSYTRPESVLIKLLYFCSCRLSLLKVSSLIQILSISTYKLKCDVQDTQSIADVLIQMSHNTNRTIVKHIFLTQLGTPDSSGPIKLIK